MAPRAPSYSVESPLPQPVALPGVLPPGVSVTFDLRSVGPVATRSYRLTQAVLIAAVVLGLAALGIFTLNVLSGHATSDPAVLSSLIPVNEYAYLSAATALYVFRLNRGPPVALTVAPEGLSFRLRSGQIYREPWSAAVNETRLYAPAPGDAPGSAGVHRLSTTPGYAAARTLLFLPPRVPRTYLTPEAFFAVLEGAQRAGLKLNRYGRRYDLESSSVLEFPHRY